jgi:O-antigen/teichoic acid export membrane protein
MLIRNSALYLAANGVSALLGFAGVFTFTRLLDPADYGVYVIGNTMAGIVSALLFTWLRHSTVRFQAEGGNADIRLSALAGYGGMLTIMPVALVIIMLIGRVPFGTVFAALLVSASMALFDLGQDILRARQLAKRAMLGIMMRAVFAFAVGLLAVWFGAGGLGLLVALSLAYLAAAGLLVPWIWPEPRTPFSRDTLKRMLAFGAPITVSGFVFAIHSGLDRLTIASLLGAEAAGQYGASADFVRQCLIFPAMSASAAIGPMAIQLLASGGRVGVQSHLEHSAELLLAVLLPAAIGLALTSADVSAVVLGPGFRDTGASVMPLLALSWISATVAQHYAHLSFSLANRPNLYIVHAIGTVALSGLMMAPMINSFGMRGAAFTVLTAETGSAIFGMYLAQRTFALPLMTARLARVLAAVAVMTAVTLLIQYFAPPSGIARLVMTVTAGALSYVAASIALNVLECRGIVQRLISRIATAHASP